jgi:diguanylate cyclase (GGDEF)-like protein
MSRTERHEPAALPSFSRLVALGLCTSLALLLTLAAASVEYRQLQRLNLQYRQALAATRLAFDAGSLADRLRLAHEQAARPSTNPDAEQLRAEVLRGIDTDLQQWRVRAADAVAAPAPLSALALALDRLRAATQPARGAAADENSAGPPWEALLLRVTANSQTLLLAVAHAPAETPLAFGHSLGDLAARLALAGVGVTVVLVTALAWMLQKAQSESRTTLGVMGELLRTDPLTGVANRRGLDENLPIELARARRSRMPLSVAMLDLDYFKRYNSRRGHDGGDALLRTAAQAWRAQLRPTDSLARYGGEEFTLVLPCCDADSACQLIERLRPVMPDNQTFSAGVATWDSNESADEVLRRADQALMLAKKMGRNRTVVSGREEQLALPLARPSEGAPAPFAPEAPVPVQGVMQGMASQEAVNDAA